MIAQHILLARRFVRQIANLGFDADYRIAGTGTAYITAAGFKARFADHGECYCRENVSVDPEGLEWWQALAAFCADQDILEPAYVKAARTRHHRRISVARATAAERMAALPRTADLVAANQRLLAEAGKGHLTGKARKRALAKLRAN